MIAPMCDHVPSKLIASGASCLPSTNLPPTRFTLESHRGLLFQYPTAAPCPSYMQLVLIGTEDASGYRERAYDTKLQPQRWLPKSSRWSTARRASSDWQLDLSKATTSTTYTSHPRVSRAQECRCRTMALLQPQLWLTKCLRWATALRASSDCQPGVSTVKTSTLYISHARVIRARECRCRTTVYAPQPETA